MFVFFEPPSLITKSSCFSSENLSKDHLFAVFQLILVFSATTGKTVFIYSKRAVLFKSAVWGRFASYTASIKAQASTPAMSLNVAIIDSGA